MFVTECHPAVPNLKDVLMSIFFKISFCFKCLPLMYIYLFIYFIFKRVMCEPIDTTIMVWYLNRGP